ncbi:MAG: MBOAT family O-acyltransferase [Limisphaerales bacterium]
MLFNSDVFLQFFAAFLLLYHFVRHRLAARNWLIVIASYVFYGWWDSRFLVLLLASSLLDYTVGLRLSRADDERHRRHWLWLSLAGNLGLLGAFKYCGFFVDSAAMLLESIGFRASLPVLHIVLPVGISFYTFQTMSYTLDVYRRELAPTKSLVNFLAYVSFFPQLVAGPIERASHLLPQFEQTRFITRTMLAEGLWLIVWGLFKKVVIADNLAPLVDLAYQTPIQSGPLVALGTIAFAFQIYGDFSGYSDIARGLARWLGFDLRWNFNLPYAARNLREFWQRWHISLSTWLRDYLYISLGGNRRGPARIRFNLLLTFLLGGLWHGAAWHFVLWGAWHGMGLLALRGWSRRHPRTPLHPFIGWLLTMVFVGYGWLLFRAESLAHAIELTRALAHWSTPSWFASYVVALATFTAPLVAMQIWQARRRDLLAPLRLPREAQAVLQAGLWIGIALFWGKSGTPFIYFQF